VADVVAFGELLVDFVPAAGPQSLVTAEIFKKAAGGAPANVAAGLARLGISSAFMGMVGRMSSAVSWRASCGRPASMSRRFASPPRHAPASPLSRSRRMATVIFCFTAALALTC